MGGTTPGRIIVAFMIMALAGGAALAAKYENKPHGFGFDYNEKIFKIYKNSSLMVMLIPVEAKAEDSQFDTFVTFKVSKDLDNFTNPAQLKRQYDKTLKKLWKKYSEDYPDARKLKLEVGQVNDHPSAVAGFLYTDPDGRKHLVTNFLIQIYDMKYEVIFTTAGAAPPADDKSKSDGKPSGKAAGEPSPELNPSAAAFDLLIAGFRFPKFVSKEAEKYFNTGLASLQSKNYQEALDSFEKCNSLEKGIEPNYYAAVALSRLEKRQEAIDKLELILQSRRDYDYAWGYKAFNLMKMNKMKEAAEVYDAALGHIPQSEILYLDRSLFKLGLKEVDNKSVFDDIQEALKINPFYPKALYQFGVLSALMRNQQMAAYCLQKATAFEPEKADYWFMLGRVLNTREDKAGDALKCFEKAIEIDPANSRYYVEKAKAFINLKDGNGALDALNAAISKDRKNLDAWYLKGKLMVEAEKPKEALTTFNRILDMNPKEPKAHVFKGNIYHGQGNNAKAEESIDKALEIDPKYIDAFLVKANIFKATGRKKEAVELYNRIIDLEPAHEDAKKRKAELIREMTY